MWPVIVTVHSPSPEHLLKQYVAKWRDVQHVLRACMSVLSSLHEIVVIVMISVHVFWLHPISIFHNLLRNPTVGLTVTLTC